MASDLAVIIIQIALVALVVVVNEGDTPKAIRPFTPELTGSQIPVTEFRFRLVVPSRRQNGRFHSLIFYLEEMN